CPCRSSLAEAPSRQKPRRQPMFRALGWEPGGPFRGLVRKGDRFCIETSMRRPDLGHLPPAAMIALTAPIMAAAAADNQTPDQQAHASGKLTLQSVPPRAAAGGS